MTRLTFKKVRSADHAIDGEAVILTLFRGDAGRVCGWFVGPMRFTADGVDLPCLPRSAQTLAAIAIIRAIQAACDRELRIVDPDDLWDPAWGI